MQIPSVVIDTNVFLSGLRSRNGASFQILQLIGTGSFITNLSVPLILEYEDVILRNLRHLNLGTDSIDPFLDYICSVSKLHEMFYLWRPILRDSKDDMILELAVKAKLDYIVTYNKSDFIEASTFGIGVIDGKEFYKLIRSKI